MGTCIKQTKARNGAVDHLEKAVEAEDSSEKDFHLRQALQLLDVGSTNA